MPIRVLHIIDHLEHGGAQLSAKNIVENINDENIEVSVCVLRTETVEIPITGDVIFLKYRRWDARVIWRIVQICKEKRIDILHPHLQKGIISSLVASFFYKCKVVVHVRGGVFLKGGSFVLYRLLLRLLRNRASVFISNSQATLESLVKKVGVKAGKIKVVYNPVDFKRFEPNTASRNQMRNRLRIAEKETVIGFVGRLHPVKGVDILIKAFASFLKKAPQSLLLLAGDGPERKTLEQLTKTLKVSELVRFLGMRDDIPAIMATFDIGVIPSRQEPFGRVAVELMRMRVPVICSGVDGLSEIVTDGDTGLITEQNTPEQITAAIEQLEKDKALRGKLIDNAFEYSKQFSAGEHVKKIEKIYEEVLNSA